MTKTEKQHYKEYLNSDIMRIDETEEGTGKAAYKKCSGSKYWSWVDIKRDFYNLKGNNLRVINRNGKHHYTAGFEYKDGDFNVFRYYTAWNTYDIYLGNDEERDAYKLYILLKD